MRRVIRESGHLARLALVLAVGVVVFLAIRAVLVPATFGRYGNYRAAALDDIRARPVSFAGKAVCEVCHEEVAKVKSQGKHAGVACEACHGPSGSHTEDPTTIHAVKPDPAKLCVRCHEAEPAKPKTFPQVASKEHANGMSCGDCYKPHTPKI
jgi:predicted CXXCH cytochrome family protein